jgi:hypothetical protein
VLQYYLGQRQGYGKSLSQNYRPASITYVSLGTVMIVSSFHLKLRSSSDMDTSLLVGLGAFIEGFVKPLNISSRCRFNGASNDGANLGAVQAVINTVVAGNIGGITWMLLDYRLQHKFSVVALCSGIVSGCVCITPCAGYASMPSALAVGVGRTSLRHLITLSVRSRWSSSRKLRHTSEVLVEGKGLGKSRDIVLIHVTD